MGLREQGRAALHHGQTPDGERLYRKLFTASSARNASTNTGFSSGTMRVLLWNDMRETIES
jgi:hypothetical protein